MWRTATLLLETMFAIGLQADSKYTAQLMKLKASLCFSCPHVDLPESFLIDIRSVKDEGNVLSMIFSLTIPGA